MKHSLYIKTCVNNSVPYTDIYRSIKRTERVDFSSGQVKVAMDRVGKCTEKKMCRRFFGV
uniref:Uncharacterized protein n=1 Tax=Anguilla anguilla TaxID=7936 RepID=A0A0E9Q536_ANGAN